MRPRNNDSFCRLGVFAGSFDAAAAVAVLGDAELDVRESLASLVAKSLVVPGNAGEERRYRPLETMRAFALERLATDAERYVYAVRHARFYCDRADAARHAYGQDAERGLVARNELDLDNYREALRVTLLERADPSLGVRIILAIQWMYSQLTLFAELLHWLEIAVAENAERPELERAHVHEAIANAHGHLGNLEAAIIAGRQAHVAYAISNSTPVLFLTNLAWYLKLTGRTREAMSTAAEAYAVARAREVPYEIGRASRSLASCTPLTEATRRHELLDEAIAIFRTAGSGKGLNGALQDKAWITLSLCSTSRQ